MVRVQRTISKLIEIVYSVHSREMLCTYDTFDEIQSYV